MYEQTDKGAPPQMTLDDNNSSVARAGLSEDRYFPHEIKNRLVDQDFRERHLFAYLGGLFSFLSWNRMSFLRDYQWDRSCQVAVHRHHRQWLNLKSAQ